MGFCCGYLCDLGLCRLLICYLPVQVCLRCLHLLLLQGRLISQQGGILLG